MADFGYVASAGTGRTVKDAELPQKFSKLPLNVPPLSVTCSRVDFLSGVVPNNNHYRMASGADFRVKMWNGESFTPVAELKMFTNVEPEE